MARRRIFPIAAAAALAFPAAALRAQSGGEPTAYTVAVRYQITGTALRTTYRLGTKVLVDQVPPAGVPPSATPGPATRTLYFLDTGETVAWEPGAVCTRGSFRGDAWLDPFGGAADLAMPGVTRVGAETIHGIATTILVSSAKPGFRLWVDPKTGLMMKSEFTPPSGGKPVTWFEVTDVQLTPPPAALFEVPARCAPRRAPGDGMARPN